MFEREEDDDVLEVEFEIKNCKVITGIHEEHGQVHFPAQVR